MVCATITTERLSSSIAASPARSIRRTPTRSATAPPTSSNAVVGRVINTPTTPVSSAETPVAYQVTAKPKAALPARLIADATVHQTNGAGTARPATGVVAIPAFMFRRPVIPAGPA